MREKYRSEVKRKALRVIAVCAAILLILIFSRWSENKESAKFDTAEKRMEFLSKLGLEPVKGSEEFHTVTIPEELDDVLIKYNEIQLRQGYDLRGFRGETLDCYTYELENYKDYSGKVYVSLYISGDEIAAGDVHSTEAEGFMTALTD